MRTVGGTVGVKGDGGSIGGLFSGWGFGGGAGFGLGALAAASA